MPPAPPPDADNTLRPFDRGAVRAHRDRAASGMASHDFLLREVGHRLAERLDDIRRDFPRVLDLGSHHGVMADLLGDKAGTELLVQADVSPAMTAHATAHSGARALHLSADEEALPFAPASFDLTLSNLSLHWVNDLPGALLQLRHALKPDGLLLASMLGGETLFELRQCLMEAELAVEGGISPRISPFAEVRDMGNLLTRAGFALPVADADTLTVTYDNALALMRDLRGMGESNAIAERRKSLSRRATLLEAAALYDRKFTGADGRIAATFQVIYLSGWAPHPSQQKPLRPGSAAQRLADALGAEERPAGDKAKP
jgi:NADH dehydrogenase [ubiquinone] 1 alpha subcomplex assembly factor 5